MRLRQFVPTGRVAESPVCGAHGPPMIQPGGSEVDRVAAVFLIERIERRHKALLHG